jgi:hypothetical protein
MLMSVTPSMWGEYEFIVGRVGLPTVEKLFAACVDVL